MPKRTQRPETYNGPSKEQFFDALGDYEERRFNMMREASMAGKILDAWEKRGGNKDDLRDGYSLRQMNAEEQQAELRRQWRVAGWMGLVAEEPNGQGNFDQLFDVPSEMQSSGIGGAPIGSKLSLVRAKTAGFNDGKSKAGPTLQEGLEQYPWEADSEEALNYAEGFGEGLQLRPPPKAKKGDRDEADEQPASDEVDEAPKSALGAMVVQLKAMDTKPNNDDPAQQKRKGRPPGSGKKQAALPAPTGSAETSVASIWDDNEPPGPIH